MILLSIAKRPAPGPAPIAPSQKITKPAAKYGVPLTVKRPADAARKVADACKKQVDRKPGVKLKQVLDTRVSIGMHVHVVCSYVFHGTQRGGSCNEDPFNYSLLSIIRFSV